MRSLATGLALAATLVSAPAMASAQYTVVDLGAIENITFAFGLSEPQLNQLGEVTGDAFVGSVPRGFIFTGDTSAALVEMGTLGGTTSQSRDINNNGFSAGFSTLANGAQRGFLFDINSVDNAATPEDDRLTNLGTLGGNVSQATALNDNNMVVGASTDGNGVTRAFRWTAAAGMQDLGTLAGQASFAHDVNNAGDVTGRFEISSGKLRAFRRVEATGQIITLLQAGATASEGNAINADGDVAGVQTSAAGVQSAVVYFADGSFVDIGFLSGFTSSEANGINDLDVVVGQMNGGTFGSSAFIWDATQGLRDLNSLIAPGSGMYLLNASAVNNAGQITGTAFVDGTLRGFLLDPTGPGGGAEIIPEPATWMMMLSGFALVSLRVGRRRRNAA